jgi:hypothetical protein
MVEKVTVYRVGEHTFTSIEEAAKYEAQNSLKILVESGPFISDSQGLAWLSSNAEQIVAALRPTVPKAPVARRGRRSKAEIEAANAAASETALAA